MSIAHNDAMSALAPTNIHQPIEGRSMRERPWFWIANEVADRYGAQIGLAGLGLYAALARYADNTSGEAWPSLATLAQRYDCDQRTIATHLAVLVDAHLIHVQYRPGRSPLITLLTLTAKSDPCKKCEGEAVPLSSSPGPRPAAQEPTVLPPTKNVRDKSLEKTPEKNPQFSSSFSSRKKTEEAPDTSWEKPGCPPMVSCHRPDELLARAHLSPETYATLYEAAEAS